MKRYWRLVLALSVCTFFAACGANDNAAWVEKDAADQPVLKCSVNVRDGVVTSARYVVKTDGSHAGYTYSSEGGVKPCEASKQINVPNADAAMTMGEMAEIMEALMRWVPENLPDSADGYALYSLLPRYAFLEPIEHAYAFSRKTQEIVALDEPYTASQAYGSIGIGLSGPMATVYIDD